MGDSSEARSMRKTVTMTPNYQLQLAYHGHNLGQKLGLVERGTGMPALSSSPSRTSSPALLEMAVIPLYKGK
ncbi:hypothetical protein FRB95_003566 [Tulasnella sp. JGI-2019a]|nr:hypothetical protein FRB95_003566 [Tulasnella sp. JGI-2019a]